MFDLTINLKTAKTVAVSSSLLAAADAVIESDPFFARHESAFGPWQIGEYAAA